MIKLLDILKEIRLTPDNNTFKLLILGSHSAKHEETNTNFHREGEYYICWANDKIIEFLDNYGIHYLKRSQPGMEGKIEIFINKKHIKFYS